MASARAIARRLRRERGFTLIELLVTISVTAVGVMAIVSTFDYSRRTVTVAEKNEVASHQAEAALERMQARSYATLALTANPVKTTDPNNPDFYLNTGGTTYQWDQGSTGPQTDSLVIDAAQGQVQHISTWTDGQTRLSGEIYRYVTSVSGTGGDARRVTVAVTVSGTDFKKPVIVSSIVTNPKAGTG